MLDLLVVVVILKPILFLVILPLSENGTILSRVPPQIKAGSYLNLLRIVKTPLAFTQGRGRGVSAYSYYTFRRRLCLSS
jgi:hypothetical protein